MSPVWTKIKQIVIVYINFYSLQIKQIFYVILDSYLKIFIKKNSWPVIEKEGIFDKSSS